MRLKCPLTCSPTIFTIFLAFAPISPSFFSTTLRYYSSLSLTLSFLRPNFYFYIRNAIIGCSVCVCRLNARMAKLVAFVTHTLRRMLCLMVIQMFRFKLLSTLICKASIWLVLIVWGLSVSPIKLLLVPSPIPYYSCCVVLFPSDLIWSDWAISWFPNPSLVSLCLVLSSPQPIPLFPQAPWD